MGPRQGNRTEDAFLDDIAEEAGHLLGSNLGALAANLVQGGLIQGADVQRFVRWRSRRRQWGQPASLPLQLERRRNQEPKQ